MMERLRKNWLISNLLIMAFGGLVAWQGCGGSGNRDQVVNSDDDRQFDANIDLNLPDPETIEISQDLSNIITDVDLERGIVSLTTASGQTDVSFGKIFKPSRTHFTVYKSELKWVKSEYGTGNKYQAFALDTGHRDDKGDESLWMNAHWNYYLWDSQADMMSDEATHRPNKAVVDIHAAILAECPFIKIGGWKKQNLNPDGNREQMKEWQPPICYTPEHLPTYQDIKKEVFNIRDSFLAAILPYLDTIGKVGKAAFVLSVIAFLAIGFIVSWPAFIATLGIAVGGGLANL